MTDYIHDEWCDMDNEGMCDCYVSLLAARDVRIRQLEADLEERTNQYHLAHAKILSREAIIKQLSETELAKEVAKLEKKIERMRERLVDAYTPSPKIIQLEEKNRQLEAENEGLKTYAMLLEGNTFHSDCIDIRVALGLNQTMAEWIIPEEHREALEAGGE